MGVWGARPPKIMTEDPVRTFHGHRSPDDVGLTCQHTNRTSETNPAIEMGVRGLAPAGGVGARPPQDKTMIAKGEGVPAEQAGSKIGWS
ncbi:hypothetical protein Atai01_08310 [Amycolatopsis taiwanensis]|uniref:Uncharacterized protein n=1 Tax=Amycolatopsis taiwanensis TaxID=342230 RepID=A0A9W6QY96_9PSEU|nr:hypothetical protein Atai01_08310 [Amycolatopsis taiwanensis]